MRTFKTASGLAAALLLTSVGARANPQTIDFIGVVTKVTAPASLPSDFTQQPWTIGQEITGSCTLDLSGIVPIELSPDTFLYQLATSYVMTIGGIQFNSMSPTPSGAVPLLLENGAGGTADTLIIQDFVPMTSIDPSGRSYFDDLDIMLFDPTGTAFTSPAQSVELSRFVVGEVGATGNAPGFSGINLDGIVASQPPAAAIPEPDMAPLLLMGFLGVGAMSLSRRRSRATK